MSNLNTERYHRDIAGQIAAALQGVRFGSIELVIHDGRVVQIEKREKIRLNDSKLSTT
jgi:hypothetical protein